MSIVTGVGLVLGGGGALYLAPSLPPETRKAALIGGVAAAGVGVFLILKGFRDGGGVLSTLTAGVFGGSPESLEDETQVVSLDAPTTELAPQGASGAAALSVRFVTPSNGGSVKKGLFSGDYTVDLELTNTARTRFVGGFEFHISEDYLLDDEEHVQVRQVSIDGGKTQRVRFTFPLASVFAVTPPDVDMLVRVGDVELAHVKFEVTT